MSFPLSTLGLSLPSPIQNQFLVCCHTKFSVWVPKCSVAAKKKDDVENKRLSLQLNCRRQALVTSCSKIQSELYGEGDVRGSNEDGLRRSFLEVYPVLKSEVLNDPSFDWTPESRLWVQQMLDYNVPREEFGPGPYIINSYKLLKEGEELTEDEVFEASIIEWCFRWTAAAALILDDCVDNSETRCDQPCWHRLPKVGNIAINDAVLLFAHVNRILKKHFSDKPYYLDLLDLFNEALFQGSSGQMLDLINPVGERDLSNYTMDHYLRIARYKTGYPLFFPIACALLMAGENLENHTDTKDLLAEIGIYFQIVNDYLDCFGSPTNTGKIGTDIESFKCSWLVVKALELANEEQKKILHDHYGKANPSDVAKVKGVYDELDLQLVFAMYESKSYNKLSSRTEAHPNKALHGLWASLAGYRQLAKMEALK